MGLEYRIPAADELRSVLLTTYTAFGKEMKDDDYERDRKVMPLDRVLAAWEDGRPVGVTASTSSRGRRRRGSTRPERSFSW